MRALLVDCCCVGFCSLMGFYGVELLTLRPTPNLEGQDVLQVVILGLLRVFLLWTAAELLHHLLVRCWSSLRGWSFSVGCGEGGS